MCLGNLELCDSVKKKIASLLVPRRTNKYVIKIAIGRLDTSNKNVGKHKAAIVYACVDLFLCCYTLKLSQDANRRSSTKVSYECKMREVSS